MAANSSDRRDGDSSGSLPAPNIASPPKPSLHPAVYVAVWIGLSSSVILFNKWILFSLEFPFPIFLTTWHLIFATIATQVLARTSTLLDGRHTVKMTGRIYLRAIVPIGFFFSLSLICGNKAYLYLSVSFIQMLKATTPVAVLLAGWGLGIDSPNLRVLGNVSFIVIGVIIASYGEIAFNLIGFLYQIIGIVFEAIRLVMVQRLLSSAEFKMDPLVSLYYFAPVCAGMNFVMFLIFEGSKLGLSDIARVGIFTLLANAMVAFGLNVSVVFLIGKTSSLVLTLCGVLKDILLVVASVVIWADPLSGLQMFGYSIALGGLVYYKLGADKLRETYVKLRNDGTVAWRNFGDTYPALRKATLIGATVIFLLLGLGSLYGGSSAGSAYTGVRLSDSSAVLPGILPGSTPDESYKPKRKLDIVVSINSEEPAKVGWNLKEIRAIKAFSGLDPNVVVYFRNPKLDQLSVKKNTEAASVKGLGSTGGDDDTYLSHIVEQWDDLAEHTLFLNGAFKDLPKVKSRIEDFFKPSTGVLSLGAGYGSCSCGSCKDPWGNDDLSRVPGIFSAVYSELCPPSNVLLSSSGQFLVSAKRIRGTPKHTYEHLKTLLESDKKHWIHKEAKSIDEPDHPSFGRVMEKSWMIAFKCVDPRLAQSCPTLGDRRRETDPDERCQCID